MKRGKPPSCPAPLTFSLQGPSHKLLQITFSLAELHPSERNPQAQQSSSGNDATREYGMCWAINFCRDFLGKRQENESFCMFPFGEGAGSGIHQASVILQHR